MTARPKWRPTPVDPWLSNNAWRTVRTALRAEWLLAAQQGAVIVCARCLRPIDLTLRYPHPGSLVVGHKISRNEAKRLGWTMAIAHDRSNLQPEHKRCSQSAGAAEGNRSPLRKMSASERTATRAKIGKTSKITYGRKSWANAEREIRDWYFSDE
jgi:hypothetical protein